MRGMDSSNGRALSGFDHLRQSVRDILSTPLGSRVMRRTYGSNLFKFVDAPVNQSTLIEIYAAASDALKIWEPRLNVDSIVVAKVEEGSLEVTINGTYLPDGLEIKVEGIVV